MPLINGVCIPPICMKRTLVAGGAQVILNVTVNGAAKPPRNVTAMFPKLLADGIAAWTKFADISCDGCVCMKLKLPNPLPQMSAPDVTVDTNTDTDQQGNVSVYTYVVTGGTYTLTSLGVCLPPGSQVKIGEKWVPVEKAGVVGSGPSSGGDKKSDEKKKKKSTTRKKLAKAKTKPKAKKRVMKKRG